MNYIADLTGGKAFYNTNDLEHAVRKAIDDAAVTYTLGYYASGDNWDGKFHKIKVSVDRSGVSVKTKKGYLAQERPAPNPQNLEALLRDAMWSPLDSTALAVTARVDPSPALPNASRFFFSLQPAEIQFSQKDGKETAALDVLFVQEAKEGKRLANFRKTLNMTLTPAQFQALMQRGIILGQDLELAPQTQAVRVVVLDRSSGQTGSVTVPISTAAKSGANVKPVAKSDSSAAPAANGQTIPTATQQASH